MSSRLLAEFSLSIPLGHRNECEVYVNVIVLTYIFYKQLKLTQKRGKIEEKNEDNLNYSQPQIKKC